MDLPAEAATPAATDHTEATPPVAKQPGLWSGLGTVALYFLLQLGLGALVGAVIGIVVGLKAAVAAGLKHQKLAPDAIAQLLKSNPDVRVILTVVTLALAAVVMTLLVRQFWPAQWSRASLPGFGFARPTSKLWYVGAIVLGLLVVAVGTVLTHLLAHGQPLNQDVTVMASKAPLGLRIALAVLVVCVAPFIEELVFRGVLLSGFASRMRIGWAIVASALVFGCAHLPDFGFRWYPVPALVLLGLALAWLRVRSRSLWPSITLHATNNLIAVATWFVVIGPR